MTAKRIRTVAIIEDEKEVRAGLSYILNHTEGFRCLDAFRSCEDALKGLGDTPDVLLCDIGLPGMSGIEGARILKERFPDLPIIMLTVYSDDEKIFESICAGASGYILKKSSPQKILDAIVEVCEGGAPMSAEIALKVLDAFRRFIPRRSPEYDLTGRENEILNELVSGNSYKSTADHLSISIHTVRFHIRSIYEKLHVHSKSEAVARVLKNRTP